MSPSVREQGCKVLNLSCALYIRCALDQGTCMSYLTREVEKTMVSSHSGYEDSYATHIKVYVSLAHGTVSIQKIFRAERSIFQGQPFKSKGCLSQEAIQIVPSSLTLTQYREVSWDGFSSYQPLCTTAQLWRFPSQRKPKTERHSVTPHGPTPADPPCSPLKPPPCPPGQNQFLASPVHFAPFGSIRG